MGAKRLSDYKGLFIFLAIANIIIILMLLARGVDAHALSSDDTITSFFTTDNLIRWGLGNGMTITVNSDDFGACQPLTSPISLICTGAPAFDIIASQHLQHIGNLLNYGNCPTTENYVIIDASENSTEQNLTRYSFSFGIPVNANNLRIQTCARNTGVTPGSGTNANYWVNITTVDGISTIILGNTYTCSSNIIQNSANSFSTISNIRYLNITIDTSQCSIEAADTFTAALSFIGLWKSGGTDTLNYVSEGLEFADYVNKQTQTAVSSGTNQPANVSTFASPTPEIFLYSGRNLILTSHGSINDDTEDDAGPVPNFFNSCMENPKYLGVSTSVSGRFIHAWEVTNNCTFPNSFLRFKGSWDRTRHSSAFQIDNSTQLFYGNTFSLFQQNLTTGTIIINKTGSLPTNAYCKRASSGQCANGADGFITMALAYPFSLAPLQAIPMEASAEEYPISGGNFEFSDDIAVQTSASSPTLQTNNTISTQAIIPGDGTHFGNAFLFQFVLQNTTGGFPGLLCPQKILVNQIEVDLFTAKQTIRSGSQGVMWGCFYLLEDHKRTLAIPLDGTNNIMLTNSHPQEVFPVVIPSGNWPSIARPPNGAGGNGYVLRHISGFVQNHTQAWQCNASNRICYGNVHTGGQDYYLGEGLSTQYNFLIRDATTLVGLNNTFVYETISQTLVATNSTGRVSVVINGDEVRFSFTKTGYKIAYFNATAGALGDVVNITINMVSDNDPRAGFRFECSRTTDANGNLIATCTGNPSDNPDTCYTTTQPGQPSVTVCESDLGGGGKVHIFGCPNDITSGFAKITGVNVSDAVSDRGLVIAEDGICRTITTTIFSTTNFNLTFFKEGYRSLSFGTTEIVGQDVAWNVNMAKGSGPGRVGVSFSNATKVQGNSTLVGGIRVITLTDLGADITLGGSDDPGLISSGNNVPVALVNMCDGLGFPGEVGHAFCGLIFMFVIMFIFAAIFHHYGFAPQGWTFATVGIAFFLIEGMMGLYPQWLMVLIVLISAAMVFRRVF